MAQYILIWSERDDWGLLQNSRAMPSPVCGKGEPNTGVNG